MKKEEKTVPVMANRAPWNELVLSGKRKVKTISFNWKHRGPILLYTSSNRVDDWGWADYRLHKKVADVPVGAIVGSVVVKDVVPVEELPQSYFDDDPNLYGSTGQAYVAIMGSPRRFGKPVPFRPPQGAIRVFRAPERLLATA